MNAEHPLRTYLKQTKRSQAEFARASGVVRSYISDIVRWKVTPGREAGQRMVVATGGKVTLEQLFAEPPRARRVA